MFTKWILNNFKSVTTEKKLELAPLTIFAGANSSGKSTIIQSMLLTAQTIQSPVHGKSVVLNGHIVRLGGHSDIVSNPRSDESVTIGFELEPPSEDDSAINAARLSSDSYAFIPAEIVQRTKLVECLFSFSNKGQDYEREMLELQPRLQSSRVKISLLNEEKGIENEISIARSLESPERRAAGLSLPLENLQAPEWASLEYEVLQPQRLRPGRRYFRGLGLPLYAKCAGGVLSHFFPLRLTIVYDAVDEEVRRQFEMALALRESRVYDREGQWSSSISIKFKEMLLSLLRTSVSGIDLVRPGLNRAQAAFDQLSGDFSFQNYMRAVETLPPETRTLYITHLTQNEASLREMIRAGRGPQFVLRYAPLPPLPAFGIDYVKTYFTSKLKYLGPLRDEPKPVYPLAGATDSRDVGYKGEHTAAVLDVHKHTSVDYIPPSMLQAALTGVAKRTAPLIEAVSDWLTYMGVVQQVKTYDRGKLGHELKVSTTDSNTFHDLTHVGVGVSQILPILVLSLLAESDSTLIFEQPELHLHPRVQTRLADFFVSMMVLKKQCIVETHSEYLINRLRYLAAVSDGNAISKDVILYFVEKANGQSNYTDIRINEYGAIPRWPKGFFDENEETSAAILKAAMGKRKNALKK